MPGGVCAVLDYEVEVMAEYVAEMSMRVVSPDTPVTTPFRKFVSQILTSTRLPRTTILLGLNYLAKRINSWKAQGRSTKATEGQVWRLVTVALLLGSKFLDDNTFQNRSWSEVSGIAVSELNQLECEWLAGCSWHLYVNLEHSRDYQAWLKNWDDWLASKKSQAARVQRMASLSPIQTTFIGPHGLPSPPYMPSRPAATVPAVDPSRYHTAKEFGQAFRPQENMWAQNQYRTGPTAPITPPDSGFSTPEYVSPATSVNGRFQDWFGQASSVGQYNAYQQPQSHISPYRRHSGHHGGHYAYWDRATDCHCHVCSGSAVKQPYFMHNMYSQPVMG
jgi:hypothetical protein